jgi:hypothetical protein
VNYLEYSYEYDVSKRIGLLFWMWCFLYVMRCLKSAYILHLPYLGNLVAIRRFKELLEQLTLATFFMLLLSYSYL